MNRLFIGSPDKTNFLLQFIAEDFSRGFTLIDPTGDLARAAANRVRYFSKIDYYNRDMTAGSKDPCDPERTMRVLTVMRADDY